MNDVGVCVCVFVYQIPFNLNHCFTVVWFSSRSQVNFQLRYLLLLPLFNKLSSNIQLFRALDESGTLLASVCSPVRLYLRERDDTVRCIVTSLTDESNTELFEEASMMKCVCANVLCSYCERERERVVCVCVCVTIVSLIPTQIAQQSTYNRVITAAFTQLNTHPPTHTNTHLFLPLTSWWPSGRRCRRRLAANSPSQPRLRRLRRRAAAACPRRAMRECENGKVEVGSWAGGVHFSGASLKVTLMCVGGSCSDPSLPLQRGH